MDEMHYIECSHHGDQPATYVCQHTIQTLEDGKARGFWFANDAANPRPDAWCSECEEHIKTSHGEWNNENEAFAGVKLLCGACYDRVKEINIGPAKKWWQLW